MAAGDVERSEKRYFVGTDQDDALAREPFVDADTARAYRDANPGTTMYSAYYEAVELRKKYLR